MPRKLKKLKKLSNAREKLLSRFVIAWAAYVIADGMTPKIEAEMDLIYRKIWKEGFVV